MSRLVIVAALWCPLAVAACVRTQLVRVPYPVPIEAPPCRERDAPKVPPGAVYGDAAWARWFALELIPYVTEVEEACPKRERATDPEPTAGSYGERVR